MNGKPSIPKGTRDFSPVEMGRRDFIFNTIRKVFKQYGYQPIETPSIENLSTLLGKYGEEGDRLIFKILNSGNFLSGVDEQDFQHDNLAKLSNRLCEKGLRYDLTVPFARYVVQHRNEIVFPFKRYQIQPVWRADRPQKGRYREFYQCDVDVIGSDSLLNEIELIQITDDIFQALDVTINIKINNRKVLSGIAEIVGEKQRMTDITVAIDKLDKVGLDEVISELVGKGVSEKVIEKLKPILFLKGDSDQKLKELGMILRNSETGMTGLKEVDKIFEYLNTVNLSTTVEFDITLARGLDYYTGAIIEVLSSEIEIGSIAGGGRYDDLTGVFGLPDVSGVGISFGADRIYDVLNQLNRFPAETESTTKLMFINFGAAEEKYCLSLLDKIREADIVAEIYPGQAKLKKQMTYANSRKIPYVALVGETEIRDNFITLKEMETGDQSRNSLNELIEKLS